MVDSIVYALIVLMIASLLFVLLCAVDWLFNKYDSWQNGHENQLWQGPRPVFHNPAKDRNKTGV